MSKVLENIISAVDFYREVFPEDVRITVFDTEKVLLDIPGEKVNWPSNTGAPLSKYEGSVVVKAMREQRKLREERGPERWGIAYISTALPLYENGRLVGALAALVSNEKVDMMRTGATTLASTVQQLNATTEIVGQASTDLSARIQDMSNQLQTIMTDVKQSRFILRSVEEIAENSKLLGLNAAIEAARLGELGKGFEVVANEIRKMADFSKTSANDINTQLKSIHQSVEKMYESFQKVAAYSKELAASLQEINSAFEDVAATSDELLNASKI
ncbi:methyl-accepting chemotaxis protein [Ferviditalea candida]|uniref:Methyl-accepting chemotaxis protein n=1 Tax=Ferviditalea candida TaxID=3108399 RepID=A0ABU5ZH59_9BACL|nr:methyl-accepting chemotaxis protein [Paenibacillaceae bacterium T2]